MVNELTALDENSFKVNVKPAEITVENADVLKKALIDYVDKFKGIVVTESTLKDAKDVKKKLNSLSKQIDRRRIDIHNNFDTPYNEFADEMKDWKSKINQVLDPINSGIKELDEQQKQKRADHVNDLLNEMASAYNVDPSTIMIDSSWLTASISEIKRKKSIADALKLKKADNDRIKANVELIAEYAKSHGIDPAGWIVQAKQDNDTELIKKQIDNEAIRRDQDAKKAEIDRQNKADYQKAIDKLNHQQQGNNSVNTETGEIVEKTIKFWVKGSPAKLKMVQKFLKDNEIEYGSVV